MSRRSGSSLVINNQTLKLLFSLLNILCIDSEPLWHSHISNALPLTNLPRLHKIIKSQPASQSKNPFWNWHGYFSRSQTYYFTLLAAIIFDDFLKTPFNCLYTAPFRFSLTNETSFNRWYKAPFFKINNGRISKSAIKFVIKFVLPLLTILYVQKGR